MSETAFTIEYDRDEQRHRVRYEPRTEGPGWWRIVEVRRQDRWEPIGREVVHNVTLTNHTDALI